MFEALKLLSGSLLRLHNLSNKRNGTFKIIFKTIVLML